MLKVPVIGRWKQRLCWQNASIYVVVYPHYVTDILTVDVYEHIKTFLQQPHSYKCQINTHNIIISNIYVE